MAGEAPPKEGERAIVHIKSNLAKNGPSLGYVIEDNNGSGEFRWAGISDLTAGDLLAPEQGPEKQTALDDAVDFLRDILEIVFIIRYAVVLPVLIGTLVLSYVSSYPRILNSTILVAVALPSIGLLIGMSLADYPNGLIYFAMLLLTILYTHAFTGVRFWLTALASWMLFFGFLAVILVFRPFLSEVAALRMFENLPQHIRRDKRVRIEQHHPFTRRLTEGLIDDEALRRGVLLRKRRTMDAQFRMRHPQAVQHVLRDVRLWHVRDDHLDVAQVDPLLMRD